VRSISQRFVGRSLVIVYPWTGRPGLPNPLAWDDIPGAHGSTPELEGFRDHAASFAALDVRLFGLSRQTTDYQRELVDRLALPFPILSDADGRFCAAQGLPSFTTGGEVYLKRSRCWSRTGASRERSIPFQIQPATPPNC
jgi:peroxiredoxin